MLKDEDSEGVNRQELKSRRNQLFKLFVKHPGYTRLAVAIKLLDDQLADWTQKDSLELSVGRGEQFQGRG